MPSEKIADAERQLLGSCLLSAEALDDVSGVITSADLWEPRHGLILDAATAVRKDGHPLSVLSVADHLGEDLERAGGMSYLYQLTGTVAVPSSAGYIAEQIIRPAALLRAVRSVGHRLVQLGEDGLDRDDVDALDVVNASRQELDALTTGRAQEDSPEQDVYAALAELEEDLGMPTPWRDLTEATGGWGPGEFVIVGARPAVGKSVIAGGIALDMARRHLHTHFASLEMSRHELYQRMLADVGSVDLQKLRRRTLDAKDWEKLASAAKHIAGLPLSVDDRGSQTVADIRARARAIARERKLGIVIVDYLQLMRSSRRVESRQQEVSTFSRDLKLLAKELHVPVVALSQLNRGTESRKESRPALTDLRESGSLEQDADAVILLHRDPDEPLWIDLFLAKHRHARAGKVVRLRWEGHYSRVSDSTPTTEPIY